MVVTNGGEYSLFLKNVLFGSDSEWFEDFKRSLSAEGFDICGVTVRPVSESHFATRVNGELVKIPAMGLYAIGGAAYRLLKVKHGISGVIDESYKEQIYRVWRDCCLRHGADIAEYCGIDMHISVASAEGVVYDNVIRRKECREEVADTVFRLSGVRPGNVYCSSQPSYNIVFEKEHYFAFDIENKKELIAAEIRAVVAHYVTSSYSKPLPEPLFVNFWHPQMPTYNGYGLARQD